MTKGKTKFSSAVQAMAWLTSNGCDVERVLSTDENTGKEVLTGVRVIVPKNAGLKPFSAIDYLNNHTGIRAQWSKAKS